MDSEQYFGILLSMKMFEHTLTCWTVLSPDVSNEEGNT